MTPEELYKRVEADFLAAAFGSRKPPRATALAFRGGRFVSLEIGDDGKVIEPPPRCYKCGPVLACLEHSGI